MLGVIPWVVDQFRSVVDLATGIPVVCIKVTNLSPQRGVEITHVRYQGEPQIHLLGSRLPARLRLDETWDVPPVGYVARPRDR